MLELPLAAATLVAAQSHDDHLVVAVSGDRRLAVDAAELATAPLDKLAERFSGRDAWGAYVLGPVALLLREGQAAPRPEVLRLVGSPREGKGRRRTTAAAGAAGRRGASVGAPRHAADGSARPIMHGGAGRLLRPVPPRGPRRAALRRFAVWGIDWRPTHVRRRLPRRVRLAASWARRCSTMLPT